MNAETETVENTQSNQSTDTKDPTIDDVYAEAGLDKIETRTTQETQKVETRAEPKVEPSNVPDPYDTENFKAYIAREAAGKTELTKAVAAIAQHLSGQERERVVAATKADIDTAVKAVNEVVGHPKPKVIEAAIDGMVRDNPQLKAIWDNRGKNPTAWSKALGIVTKQIADDFSAKVDPKLVEANRARKESQRQMATTSKDDHGSPTEERLGKATGQDFDVEWQRLLGGN